MSSLKTEVKAVREEAFESLEAAGLDEGASELAVLAHVAVAALRRLEAAAADAEGGIAEDAKAARKLLKPHLKSSAPPQKRAREADAEADGSPSPSLGQYAAAGAFAGDESKKQKFARLMGGAKADAKGEQRNTQARDSTTIHRINRELENQYETALGRKGKKGLGA